MLKHYDVLVIGTGSAGLYGAININPQMSVLAVCKKDIQLSNSDLAQGGIAAVTTDNDSFESHIKDTMIAGKNENNIDAVTKLIKEGPSDIFKLIEL